MGYKARATYYQSLWIPRALKFARSLQGRSRTPEEQAFRDQCRDSWDYFRVFGIQEETQAYINETIRQIESLRNDDLGYGIIAQMRIKWSVTEIARTKELGRW